MRLLPQDEFALVPKALIGVPALRELIHGHSRVGQVDLRVEHAVVLPQPLAALLTEMAARGKGVICATDAWKLAVIKMKNLWKAEQILLEVFSFFGYSNEPHPGP